MIELITGLPGNCKTLNMMRTVIDRAAQENRPVYYAGIKGLLQDDERLKGTSWTQIEAEKWMDCPDGSIIVIDECQKTFRARTLGTVPPKHVTELEEHRHRGMDFFMATQHPSLVDPALRRLVQTHRHMVRIFGMEASTIHRWDRCVDHPDKPQFRKDSEKSKWAFDKSLYGVYHSATIHTAKRRIPMRLKLLALVPVLVVAACFGVYKLTAGKHSASGDVVASKAPGQKVRPSSSVASAGDAMFNADLSSQERKQEHKQSGADDPVQDVKEYAWRETPRVAGVPETAPKYDELRKPVRVPVPAMCFQLGDARSGKEIRCQCYSQQATPMDGVPFNMCVEFARHGRFLDFDPDPTIRAEPTRADRSVAVLGNRPDAAVPVREVQNGPAVTILPGKAMGPQRTDISPGLNEAGEIEDGPPNNRSTRAARGTQVAS
jgi:zona occludens toxin